MTPGSSDSSAVSDVYELLRSAAIRRQPVAAIYDGQPRVLCPHVGVGRKAGATSFVINLAGEATVSSRFRQRARAYGVASEWRDSAKSSCKWVIGTPNHDPSGRPVLMRSF